MAEALAIRKSEAIQRLTASLEDVVMIRHQWLDDKRLELEKAIEANKALAGSGASETKLRYSRNRVAMLRKVVNILEAGFIPMPRFSSDTLNVDFEELPVKALTAISDAKATALFDEIRYVRGEEPISNRGRYGRRPQRDPLLVGVVRMPSANLTPDRQWNRIELPAREEHFLLCWWRPTEETDENTF